MLSSSQNSRSSNNNRNPLEEAFMKESSSSSSEMKFPVLDGDFPSEREGQEKFAQTMTTISPEERARVLDDLHGVSAETEESPEFLAKHLLLFEQEVERQKVVEEALALALTKDPAYVGSQKIRLQFLRSESFRVPAAVARFARHFKLKRELFGVEKLTKDITQDDLDEETMRLLYGGRFQNLPLRDRSGRHILLYFSRTNSKEIDATCMMRRLYYIAMVNVESIEAQKKGDSDYCVAALQSFGIPANLIAYNEDISMANLAHHVQQMEDRRKEERRLYKTTTVMVPSSSDILVGKGRPFQEHPGNVMLREWIVRRQDIYETAQRYEKKRLVQSVVDQVQSSGGRFLKDGGRHWQEVDETVACAKVGHLFRDRKRPREPKAATAIKKAMGRQATEEI